MSQFVRIICTITLLAATALGQIRNSTIVGTLLDPNGAAVSGAEVTVREVNTNATHNIITSDSGEYTVPYLPIGKYVVTALKA